MIQNTYCKFHVSGKRKCSFRIRGTSLRRHTSVQLTHLEAGTENMSTSLSWGENKTASPNVLKKYEEMLVMAVAMLTDDLHSPENWLCTGTFFSIMMSHVCFCMVWMLQDHIWLGNGGTHFQCKQNRCNRRRSWARTTATMPKVTACASCSRNLSQMVGDHMLPRKTSHQLRLQSYGGFLK